MACLTSRCTESCQARAAGIQDLEELAAWVRQAQEALGRPTLRWSPPCLLAALDRAINARGWPAGCAVPALLAVAADPASKGPMRLAEPGPWWDQPSADTRTVLQDQELFELENRLADVGGRRVLLQRQAREQLVNKGLPVTRLTVARRACNLLAAS